MLTFFTTGKPYLGHSGIIQRNALKSWTLLHPNVEVIVFGGAQGAADACAELGLRHEPNVECSESGLPYINSMFARAEKIARNDYLCYSNCDIVLTQDFARAVERIREWRTQFLMVGRRWDTDVTEAIDFSPLDWQERIVTRAKAEGVQRFYHNIDYFTFSRGLYLEMPALVVGRVCWDHWMVWKALATRAAVVDASEAVCAVHQNHDYAHVPGGWQGVAQDEDARRNFVLTGGVAHMRTIEDASFRLTLRGVEKNRWCWLVPVKRRCREAIRKIRAIARTRVWHPLMNSTRPLRHAMGLKIDAMPATLRSKERRHRMDE